MTGKKTTTESNVGDAIFSIQTVVSRGCRTRIRIGDEQATKQQIDMPCIGWRPASAYQGIDKVRIFG
jgi:hypothetical protein